MTADRPGLHFPAVRAVAALEDDSRRRLFQLVRSAGRPVTREDAATALGIPRKLATFHLDRLVEVGLLTAEFDIRARRRPVGRAPKTYRPAEVGIAITIPQRRQADLADLLLESVATATAGETPAESASRVAHAHGQALGAAAVDAGDAAGSATRVLEQRGYEPVAEPDGVIRLRNCPLGASDSRHAQLVCALNHRLVTGVLDGLQAPQLTAVLAPGVAGCCVEVRPVASSA